MKAYIHKAFLARKALFPHSYLFSQPQWELSTEFVFEFTIEEGRMAYPKSSKGRNGKETKPGMEYRCSQCNSMPTTAIFLNEFTSSVQSVP